MWMPSGYLSGYFRCFFMLDYQAKSASGDPEAGFMVFSLILVVVAGLFGAWWNKHKNG